MGKRQQRKTKATRKKQSAKKSTKKRTKKAGQKRGRGAPKGQKQPRHAKGVVSGTGARAGRVIDKLLDETPGLTADERGEIRQQYVSLSAGLERLTKLIQAGTASTTDQMLQVRTRRELERIKKRLLERQEVIGASEQDAIDASDRAAFCEAHLTMPDGGPFELEGREWQREQFWAPLDGFKLWPVDRESLCTSCAAKAGNIVGSVYAADSTRTARHAETGCAGLRAHIIWLVCLQLKRQQGKTVSVAGYTISSLWRYSHESIAYLAGSEDQSEMLVRDNFTGALSDRLMRDAQSMRTRLIVEARNSEFQLFATSLAGSTGGSRTLVIVDEARDVPSHVFSAMVPTIYARRGWRCPTGQPGHAWSTGDLDIIEDQDGAAVNPKQERYGQRCPVCNARLEPWSGRVAAMSSAQELDDSDADWFHDLCEQLEREPEPDAHVFRSSRVINPKVSRQIVSRSEAVLGKVKGLSDSISIEAGGVSRRKGELFLDHAQIRGIEDPLLRNLEGCSRPAVGFLDTSDVTHLTSLVILEDDSRDGERPWHRLRQVYLEVWDPKDQPHKFIDDRIIKAALLEILPSFALLALRIDDRRRPWAKAMLRELKKEAPFSRILKGCDERGEKWGRNERQLGWQKFHERAVGRTITIFQNQTLRAELKAARNFSTVDGEMDVREKDKRKRHLDIAEAIASCCLMAHELSVRGRRPGLAAIEGRRRSAATIVASMRGRRKSRVPNTGRGDY